MEMGTTIAVFAYGIPGVCEQMQSAFTATGAGSFDGQHELVAGDGSLCMGCCALFLAHCEHSV